MLRVLELFAGIGACSKALERLGIEHEIVDAVEVDKYAIKSFNAIHGTSFEPQDIREWDKDIQVDLVMHGSPCQDFSVAGKGAGGDEGSGTRSSLMYETLRIVEKLKPEIVIWENVKNLWGKKHRHNWENYADKMGELGYDSAAKIINARDCGIPQNRERLFTISIKRGSELVDSFMFPEPIPLEKKLKDMLEDEVDEKYYLSEKAIESLLYQSQKQKDKGNHFEFKPRDIDSFASCISTRSGQRKTDNFIRVKNATRGGIWMLMMEMGLIVHSYQAKRGEVEFSIRWRRRFQRLRQLSESMIRCASESSHRLNAGGLWASMMKILGRLKRYAQRASYISKLGIASW